jgi:hypothetical protein
MGIGAKMASLMFNKSKKDLKETIKNNPPDSREGLAARHELARREEKTTGFKDADKTGASSLYFNRSASELRDIASKKSGDTKEGMAARNELTRREERREFKKGNPTWKGETEADSRAPGRKYKVGGVVKKAPAKKPIATKKPAVKKPTKKGK